MRVERGLSLREAARRAGVVKETISDIERGHTHPYDVTLAKLAKAYEVPVEDVLQEPVLAGKGEAPQEPGRIHHVRMPHDSIEAIDEVKVASVRLEKVRQILDARDAGKLDDVDADKEIQRKYQQEDPAA